MLLPPRAYRVHIQKAGHTRKARGDIRAAVHEDKTRTAVFQHMGDAFRRIVRIQGNIGAARLEDAQHGNDNASRAGQHKVHPVFRLYAQSQQTVGQTVGLGIEPGIRIAAFGGHKGRMAGTAGGHGLKDAVQHGFGQGGGGLVETVQQGRLLRGYEGKAAQGFQRPGQDA